MKTIAIALIFSVFGLSLLSQPASAALPPDVEIIIEFEYRTSNEAYVTKGKHSVCGDANCSEGNMISNYAQPMTCTKEFCQDLSYSDQHFHKLRFNLSDGSIREAVLVINFPQEYMPFRATITDNDITLKDETNYFSGVRSWLALTPFCLLALSPFGIAGYIIYKKKRAQKKVATTTLEQKTKNSTLH